MRPVNQTVEALTALAIALKDNESQMTEQMRESLTEAVHRTVMERKSVCANNHKERNVNDRNSQQRAY